MLALCSTVGLAPQETAGQDDACQLADLESSALKAPRKRELLQRYEVDGVDGEQVEQSRVLPVKQPWYRIAFYMFPTAHLLAISGSLAYLWDARGRPT